MSNEREFYPGEWVRRRDLPELEQGAWWVLHQDGGEVIISNTRIHQGGDLEAVVVGADTLEPRGSGPEAEIEGAGRYYLAATGQTCYDREGVTWPERLEVEWGIEVGETLGRAGELEWGRRAENLPEEVTFTATRREAWAVAARIEELCREAELRDVGFVPQPWPGEEEDAAAAPGELSRAQAQVALDLLVRYGRQGYTQPETIGRGKALGHAIYAHHDVRLCIEAAGEMLEQWNGHLMVAAIQAIDQGQWDAGHDGEPPHGSVSRDGRELRIRLPKWWEDKAGGGVGEHPPNPGPAPATSSLGARTVGRRLE